MLTRSPLKRRTPLRSASRLKTRKPLGTKARPKRGPRIDYSLFAIAKNAKPVPVLWEYPGGKVIYNLRHPQGEQLYRGAVSAMWERQGKRCSIGGEYIPFTMATFEHGGLRVKGAQDDRIDIVDAEGFFINSAACREHNCKKGSRRNYPLAIRISRETA